jgi:hypothetical protein
MITSIGLQQLGFTLLTDFVLQDDSDGNGVYIKEWLSDQPQPSEADITTAHNEWQSAYDNKLFQRQRADAYPSMQEQADMQYWDSVNGTTTWQDAIALVKSTYPKGGS